MTDIESLKAVLPSDLREYIPNLKHKNNNESCGPCPKCSGEDRFIVFENKFFCRQCDFKGDIIDYIQYSDGVDLNEMKEIYLDQHRPDLKIDRSYLKNIRKIPTKTIEENYKNNNIEDFKKDDFSGIVFYYKTLSGKVWAKQFLTVEKNKVIKKFQFNSKPSEDGFFICGKEYSKSRTVIFYEAAINALSGAVVLPTVCHIAIGSTSYLKKLNHFKGHDKNFISFHDNDEPGEKLRDAVQEISLTSKSINWGDYPKKYDANDLIKNNKRKEYSDLVENATRYIKQDPIFTKPKKEDLIYTSDMMVDAYQEYIKNQEKNRFITGIDEIDRKIRGVAGGEVLTIIARAGAYKTTILQNMIKNYLNHSSWGAAFFSIEMPIPNVTERFISMDQDSYPDEVEATFKDRSLEKFQNSIKDKFNNTYKNLFTIPCGIKLSDIPEFINIIQTKYNKKIGVIGIDYMGLITGDKGRSTYEIISNIAREIKTTAKLLNIPLVVLCQASRQAGSGSTEMSLDMARDSGAIEESADFVLGLWQTDSDVIVVGSEDIKQDLICKVLKNRKGPKNSMWKLDLTPETFHIGGSSEKYTPPKTSKGGI